MGLWGASTSDESKPKNLTTAEKRDVFANASGWVRQAGTADNGNDNTSATPEVLVAIGDLSTSLGNATIDAVSFDVGQTVSGAGGSVIKVFVHYNEQVTVATASPLMVVSNDQTGSGGSSSITLTMDGTLPVTSDTLQFSATATNAAVNATDVLSIGAQNVDKNGGTIKDAGTTTDSAVAISAAQGTAAGTITVGS
tara:strand:- start:8418 stop:9005 length:588 start_codon:yes stop_codon:yes gene_type:complete